MLYLPKQTTHKGGFLMKSITQDIKYYQAILSYADQHGVTKAAIKYRTYRQFIYSVMENFFGLLKQEIYYGRIYHSYEELKTAIEEYIVYYNECRIKESLGWLSPAQYRRKQQVA